MKYSNDEQIQEIEEKPKCTCPLDYETQVSMSTVTMPGFDPNCKVHGGKCPTWQQLIENFIRSYVNKL